MICVIFSVQNCLLYTYSRSGLNCFLTLLPTSFVKLNFNLPITAQAFGLKFRCKQCCILPRWVIFHPSNAASYPLLLCSLSANSAAGGANCSHIYIIVIVGFANHLHYRSTSVNKGALCHPLPGVRMCVWRVQGRIHTRTRRIRPAAQLGPLCRGQGFTLPSSQTGILGVESEICGHKKTKLQYT